MTSAQRGTARALRAKFKGGCGQAGARARGGGGSWTGPGSAPRDPQRVLMATPPKRGRSGGAVKKVAIEGNIGERLLPLPLRAAEAEVPGRGTCPAPAAGFSVRGREGVLVRGRLPVRRPLGSDTRVPERGSFACAGARIWLYCTSYRVGYGLKLLLAELDTCERLCSTVSSGI